MRAQVQELLESAARLGLPPDTPVRLARWPSRPSPSVRPTIHAPQRGHSAAGASASPARAGASDLNLNNPSNPPTARRLPLQLSINSKAPGSHKLTAAGTGLSFNSINSFGIASSPTVSCPGPGPGRDSSASAEYFAELAAGHEQESGRVAGAARRGSQASRQPAGMDQLHRYVSVDAAQLLRRRPDAISCPPASRAQPEGNFEVEAESIKHEAGDASEGEEGYSDEEGEPDYQAADAVNPYTSPRKGPAVTDVSDPGKDFLDLSPLVDPHPLSVLPDTSSNRVLDLFQSLGVSLVAVVARRGRLLGVVKKIDILVHVAKEHSRADQLGAGCESDERDIDGDELAAHHSADSPEQGLFYSSVSRSLSSATPEPRVRPWLGPTGYHSLDAAQDRIPAH